jgi:hypothetical protein
MRYLLLLFLLPLILFGQNIKEINDYPWETIGISNKLTGQPKLKKTTINNEEIYNLYFKSFEYTSSYNFLMGRKRISPVIEKIDDFRSVNFSISPYKLDEIYSKLKKSEKKYDSLILDKLKLYYRKKNKIYFIKLIEKKKQIGIVKLSNKELDKLFGLN